MNLNSGDLEKLRVFFAIVQANGIANARGVLNKDASTISRALTQLEERLQLRLCERGRQGFALTPEGRAVGGGPAAGLGPWALHGPWVLGEPKDPRTWILDPGALRNPLVLQFFITL